MNPRLAPFPARPPTPARRRAFTLIELMVVISIIALLLGMSVPVFRAISGTRSVAAGQNKVSAMIARARGLAIGLQRSTGVWFYIDHTTGRYSMAIVYATPAQQSAAVVETIPYLDLDTDQSIEPLPDGIGLQTLTSPYDETTHLATDKYIGYNAYNNVAPSGTAPAFYGGVILFDSVGRLSTTRYGFRLAKQGTVTPALNAFFNTYTGSGTPTADFVPGTGKEANAPRAQIGVALYDLPSFNAQRFTLADPTFSGGSFASSPDEATEEAWLDDNATVLLVGRFNGNLIHAQ